MFSVFWLEENEENLLFIYLFFLTFYRIYMVNYLILGNLMFED